MMNKKRLVINLDKNQEKQLKIICDHLGMKMDDFVSKAIEELANKVFAK